MVKKLLFAFAFLIGGISVVAQNTPQPDNHDKTAIKDSDFVISAPALRHSTPLVVINAGDKTAQILPADESNHSFSTLFQDIRGSWVQSITVLTERDARGKYGNQGRYGAVVIEIKEGAFDKMPAHISERFK
jgi:hypothetical protein